MVLTLLARSDLKNIILMANGYGAFQLQRYFRLITLRNDLSISWVYHNIF